MPRHLHIDFETYSAIDLRDVGAYRYAFDPSTEILCAAMALDDEEPVAWWKRMWDIDRPSALEMCFSALEDPDVLIYAHNAAFEMAICQALLEKTWDIPCPDLSRFRCTMSLARRAALPGKLETLAEVLGLKQQKDPKGKKLIKLFCEMQKPKAPTKKNPEGLPARRIRPEDEPEKFAEFVEYCRQDVRTEQEVARKLAYFDEPINNANYSLDAVINARGVTVNLSALRHAQKLIDEETEIVSARFRELTGFNPTQGGVFLEWLHAEGVHLDNLQAETIENFLEGLEGDQSWPVQALKMKQSIAYASIKKVATMLECAGPHDNRIRGMLNHHGTTPGRWTASLVQFQNMKKAAQKFRADGTEVKGWTDAAYQMICEGVDRETLEICFGPVLETVSSCIRHFVHDTDGVSENPILDVDYAAIQARVTNWLAGQEDALEEYRQGLDRYKVMASAIYGVPYEAVNKFPQRFLGKTTILACSFGMGKSKFRDTCRKQGYDLPMGMENAAIDSYRARHHKIVRFWKDLESAAKKAIVGKGQVFKAGPYISFKCMGIEGIPFLLMRLPSGRKLAYPRPRLIAHRSFEGQMEIVFYGNIKGTTWGDVGTWGGTLAENATMGVEADIMFHGLHGAEAAGYETMTCIHDQALTYHKPGQTAEELIRLLTDLPTWAEGLPIAAEGGLVPYYRKD